MIFSRDGTCSRSDEVPWNSRVLSRLLGVLPPCSQKNPENWPGMVFFDEWQITTHLICHSNFFVLAFALLSELADDTQLSHLPGPQYFSGYSKSSSRKCPSSLLPIPHQVLQLNPSVNGCNVQLLSWAYLNHQQSLDNSAGSIAPGASRPNGNLSPVFTVTAVATPLQPCMLARLHVSAGTKLFLKMMMSLL